jgi:predicted transcriptional regulator
MGDLFELFFELSNEERMRILVKLRDDQLRLSHISSELSLPVQEVSRQLSRLTKQELVEKTSEGSYAITNLAQQVLRFVPSIRFLSDNSEYIKEHNMDRVPDRFVMRIGEVASSTFEGDVMKHFHKSEQMIMNAEEYIWIMSDQILMSSLKHTEVAVNRGVEHRFIGPRNLDAPKGFYEEAAQRGLIGLDGKAKSKFLARLDILITMTEKETMFQFPTTEDSFDYKVFQSTDPTAIKWCKELFSYYWESTDIRSPDALR